MQTIHGTAPSANVRVTVDVAQVLEFEYANPVAFTIQPGTAVTSADLETSVSTNNLKGYSLKVKAVNGTYGEGAESYTYTKAPNLEYAAPGGTIYELPAISGKVMPTTSSGWGIGCKVATGVTCAAGTGYMGLTTEYQTIVSRTGTADGADAGLIIGAVANAGQVAGTYRGLIQITAALNE